MSTARPIIDPPAPSHSPTRPGFRLRRLEMFNWGTFHHKVTTVTPEGGWTLLVGENGSGKSTAVDALRTLLVPPKLLHYNDASGEQKRRDRSRRTYIRGAWSTSSQEDTAAARIEYLRQPGEQTILLAVFANEQTRTDATLVQILWETNEKANEIFAISRGDRSIAEHLADLGKTSELRRTLRARRFDPYDSFAAYEETFRKYLAIPSRSALEVFNQAIGVKEITDVGSFIRRHMLEPSDAVDFIRDHLQPHYRELDACWQAIQKAKAQIEKLQPIAECHRKIEDATAKRTELESQLNAADLYYAHRHLALLKAEGAALDARLTDLTAQIADLDAAHHADEAERDALLQERARDAVEQSIQRIDANIREAHASRQAKQHRRDGLDQLLATLGKLRPPQSPADFDALRARLDSDRGLITGNRDSTDEKGIAARVQQTHCLTRRAEAFDELQNLRTQRALIPREFVAIRQALCDATGIEPDDLPFAGELMEVKSEHREWTGAIERLLHGLGISLLVPARHYTVVTQLINARRLTHGGRGLRLEYSRVPENPHVPRKDILLDARRVPARLGFRANHALVPWLKAELSHRFTHACCDSVKELESTDYGLTKEGLIRNGPTRHVKDDRHAVSDVANYVLGWSSEAKKKAWEQALAAAEREATEAGLKAKEAATAVQAFDAQLAAIRDVLAIERFADIDVHTEQQTLLRLQQERDDLEASSDHRKTLNALIKNVESRIDARRTTRTELDRSIGAADRDQKANAAVQQRIESVIATAPTFDPSTWHEKFAALQDEKQLTLANITDVATQAAERVRRRISHQNGEINTATNKILPAMTKFLDEYAEETSDKKAEVAYAAEFVALQQRLEKEELPKHQQRFEEFLSVNLIADMAHFRQKLDTHRTELVERIDSVNAALKRIPFNEGTHVEIIQRNKGAGDETAEFRAELKACLAGGLNASPDDRARIFGHIRDLIAKFDRDEAWTRRVTDARNWLEFGVQEYADLDNRKLNYYAASTGKSGGQKTKLAFTILASAITAQYGLVDTASAPAAPSSAAAAPPPLPTAAAALLLPGVAPTPNDAKAAATFRFVVIDEAFARTDEANSERALKLFQSLGLQLLVVSPFDAKSRIVEDYVDSFHLALNPDGGNSTIRLASRAEYDAACDDVPARAVIEEPSDAAADTAAHAPADATPA